MTIQEHKAGTKRADRRWQSLALMLVTVSTMVACSGQDESEVQALIEQLKDVHREDREAAAQPGVEHRDGAHRETTRRPALPVQRAHRRCFSAWACS